MGTTTLLKRLVGPARFELATSCTPNRTREIHEATYFQWYRNQWLAMRLLKPVAFGASSGNKGLQNHLHFEY
jgi:hypothetical protein